MRNCELFSESRRVEALEIYQPITFEIHHTPDETNRNTLPLAYQTMYVGVISWYPGVYFWCYGVHVGAEVETRWRRWRWWAAGSSSDTSEWSIKWYHWLLRMEKRERSGWLNKLQLFVCLFFPHQTTVGNLNSVQEDAQPKTHRRTMFTANKLLL